MAKRQYSKFYALLMQSTARARKSILRMVIFVFVVFVNVTSFADGKGGIISNIPDGVKKIYFMLASPKGVGQATFGHALLRFGYGENPVNSDIVVEFVAQEDNSLEIIRGLGIYNAYPSIAQAMPFETQYYQDGLLQNRDLTSYELLISDEQKQKMIRAVNDVLSGKRKLHTYSFANYNCAEMVDEVLNLGFDKAVLHAPLDRVPLLLPRLLKQKHLIGKEYVSLGGFSSRKNIVRDFYNQSGDIFNQSQNDLIVALTQNLRSQLESSRESQRVYAYFKLIYLRTLSLFSAKQKGALFVLLNRLQVYESYSLRNRMLAYVGFKPSEKLLMLPLERTMARSHDSFSTWFDSFEVQNANLTTRNDEVGFSFSGKGETHEPGDASYDNGFLALDEIVYSDHKAVWKNNPLTNTDLVVSYELNEKLYGVQFYNNNTAFNIEAVHIRGDEMLLPFLIMDVGESGYSIVPDKSGIFPILNGANKNTLGECYAVMQIQKMLQERVVFDVSRSQLSPSQNLELLKKLLFDENVVVVPGYGDVVSWIHSMGDSEVYKVVTNYQHDRILDHPLTNLRRNAKREFLTSDNMYLVKNLTELGFPVTMDFALMVEDKNHILKPSMLGHAILVYKVIEREDRFDFLAFDPNMGLAMSPLASDEKAGAKYWFYFDKKSELVIGTFKGKLKPLLPQQDVMLESRVRDLTATSFAKMIQQISKVTGRYNYKVSDIYKF